MTWAYSQLRYTPDVQTVVLTEKVANRDVYPWDGPVVAASPAQAFRRRCEERLRRPAAPRAWRHALRASPPDIVHSHFGYRGWRDLRFVGELGARHVVTFYGHDVRMFPERWPVWRRRYAELFAAADAFLCEGPFMAGTLVTAGAPAARVHVQRLGVDLDRLAFTVRRAPEDGVARVLIAGAFREKKGIPDALEAVAVARDAGCRLQVTLVGGPGADAAELAEERRVLEVIERRRLGDTVRVLGFQPYERLLKELATHHVFLAPSRHAADGDSEGGAPVTVIEAAATGMPVVATRHCDIPEVVVDGVTGLLAGEGDVEGIAARLAEALAQPERWEAMGRAARAHVEEHYDVRRCAAQLRESYGVIAAASRSGIGGGWADDRPAARSTQS
jgi:colanic acid/amylovoran biosynthesis glycosyltransferase